MRRPGFGSLLLGVSATALLCCPWLPSAVAQWIRFLPLYFTVPVGICAIISGVGTLHALWEDETADRRYAWAGVAFGSVGVGVPAAFVVWMLSAY